ncbi:MAG: MupG family TIM beta-alpha barrel fold protein [Micropruina sp.]
MRDWGVTMVRIDYGFTPAEVARIARAGGFRIAVNASTVTADELAELDGLDVVGWHNYYPRPETGLSGSVLRRAERVAVAPRARDLRLHPG